ncbi:hypothetical protein NHF46_15530 [Arthrobacter alpinus]|nr:hypothetical protein [Arthrobacter alpinus]
MARNSGRTASNLNVYTPKVTGPLETKTGAGQAVPQDHDLQDIATRQDILTLVETFYTKAFHDDLIGHIFTDVVHMDLAAHMPPSWRISGRQCFSRRACTKGMR